MVWQRRGRADLRLEENWEGEQRREVMEKQRVGFAMREGRREQQQAARLDKEAAHRLAAVAAAHAGWRGERRRGSP